MTTSSSSSQSKHKSRLAYLAHQIKPSNEILDAIRNKQSKLFVAATGSGKSVAIAIVLSQAYNEGLINRVSDTLKLYSTLVILPKNSKLQFTRYLVKSNAPLHEIGVESPGGLVKSDKFNKILFEYRTSYINGEMQLSPTWITENMPELLIVDEAQMLRSDTSQITQLVFAYIQQGGKVIFISATPFSKVTQAKCVAYATGIAKSDIGWNDIKWDCLRGMDENKPHPAAMERFNNYLKNHNAIVKMRAIYRNKCHVLLNNIDMLDWQQQHYNNAWNTYLEKLAKLDKSTPTGIREVWVAMMQYIHAAEECKAFNLAQSAFINNKQTNNQIFIGAKYLSTLEMTKQCLIKQGVPINQIGEFHGKVTYNKRIHDWDMFQQGKIDYILTSVKCGGSALSFDHQAEFPLSRPRTSIIPLCYSPFDWIQLVGRTHRTNTISDSTVLITLFNNTIEQWSMAPRLTAACKSLAKVIGRNESLTDVLVNGIMTKASDLQLTDTNEDVVNEDGEDNSDEEPQISDEEISTLQDSLIIK